MSDLATACQLLSDPVRLRMLRLLARDRLNVSELTGILGIAQSGVSRHLGLLKDGGFVEEARSGGFTFFDVGSGRLRHGALWLALDEHYRMAAEELYAEDDARLQEVLRLRKENFAAHGTSSDQLVPGRSWAAWARALGHLLPALDVVDIGCGEGYLTLEICRWARRVTGVDASADVLARARRLAAKRHLRNVTWHQALMERLPLHDATVDVALLSQALHHAEEPRAVVAEASRVLRPGGRVLVLDLRTHDERWVRQRFGDRWLGFDAPVLAAHLTAAGFTDVKVDVGTQAKGDPFVVLVASGRKPPAETGTTSSAAGRAGRTPAAAASRGRRRAQERS